MNVMQLKLITGEEILCDIITAELNEYEEEILFMKNAYSLVSTEDFDNQVRYYTFRPFMMHQYESSKLLALNAGSVICSVVPDEKVIVQYVEHVKQFQTEDEEKSILDSDEDDTTNDPSVIRFKPRIH